MHLSSTRGGRPVNKLWTVPVHPMARHGLIGASQDFSAITLAPATGRRWRKFKTSTRARDRSGSFFIPNRFAQRRSVNRVRLFALSAARSFSTGSVALSPVPIDDLKKHSPPEH